MENPSESSNGRTTVSAGSGRSKRGSVARSLLVIGMPALVATIGIAAVVLWLRAEPQVSDIEPRLPESVRAPAMPTTPAQPTTGARTTGTNRPDRSATTSPGTAASVGAAVPTLPGAWPRFRGPNLDAISTERVSLANSWGAGQPRKLWSIQLGEGYAAPAVLNSRVYLLDYDQANRADKLLCLALADGSEIWSQSYSVEVKRNHGMSRTVPAVTDKYVVSLGPKCHVMCCDAATGSVRWKIDLVGQYGTKVPAWYAGQCPLIDGSSLILAPGGTALMIAVGLATGEEIWRTPNPHGWQMTHSSIMPMTFAGKKMYVYPASGGVVGVSAKDGSILWETTDWRVSTANCPSPLPIGDGRIFLCGGYGAGAMMLRLKSAGGKITPSVVYRLKPQVFGSHQHTPILYNNHIYGVIPSKELSCIDLNGKTIWKSGSTKRFGINPYMIADGKIYVMSDAGELVMAQASPAGYKELGRAKVLGGKEPWGPLALAGGRLLARDLTSMVCLDVTAN